MEVSVAAPEHTVSETLNMFRRLIHLHATTLYLSNAHWYSSNKITKAFRMLSGPNFHCRDCTSTLVVPFLSQTSAVHMFRPYLFTSLLMLGKCRSFRWTPWRFLYCGTWRRVAWKVIKFWKVLLPSYSASFTLKRGIRSFSEISANTYQTIWHRCRWTL